MSAAPILHLLRRLPGTLAMAAALWAGAAPLAQAASIYDNLGSSRDGSDPIFGFGPLANSFSTGAGSADLGGVQLLLGNLSAAYAGTLQVLLLADSAPAPAPGAALSVLGSLSYADVATGAGAVYGVLPTSPVHLAANTRYWIELVGSSPNAIQWSWSSDLSAAGTAGQYTYSPVFGVTANSADFGPYQMAIQLAVPEPASWALTLAGLAIGIMVLARRRS